MIKIYKASTGILIMQNDRLYQAQNFSFDDLFRSDDPLGYAKSSLATSENFLVLRDPSDDVLSAPLDSQEIWAAGVTYFRSREARMEESKSAGNESLYDKVYEAERPELFFKATASRTRGHRHLVRVRSDSNWNVPEPELTIAVTASGDLFGYTIGNDLSSREIEGQNPLYLTQAKVYKGSCSIGPCLVICEQLPKSTVIRIEIVRDGDPVFTGETDLSQIKRGFEELIEYLYQDNEFPYGCLLMTGTGIVPPSTFSLQSGDLIRISVDSLGVLVNTVE